MTVWPLHRPLCPPPDAPIQAWFPKPALVAPLDPDALRASAGEPVPWEAQCIRETQNGYPQSFNPLVAHYAPRIRAYLYRMVRNREEAEDLTQETFLKAFNALPNFQAERPFKRWLFTIATNTGLNAIRARKRRGHQVALEPETFAVDAPQPTALHHVPERGDGLEAALATLAPRSQQLITLHYHEGFTLQEAGDMLGISEGAAKVTLCRARQQLRKRLLEGDAP